MNLSLARSSTRIKQLGVRRLMGASRSTVALMILAEAGAITLLATCCSLFLMIPLMPILQELTEGRFRIYTDLPSVLFLFGLAMSFTVVAGIYPAARLSTILPTTALRGTLPKSLSRMVFGRILVIFQLCLSMLLIIAVVVVYKQMDFVQSKNLGIDKEQVLLIQTEGGIKDNATSFKNEIKTIPGVENVSGFNGSLTYHATSTKGVDWQGKASDQHVTFKYLFVDKEIAKTLGIKLLAQVADPSTLPEQTIMINQAALKAMGLNDPIGMQIKLWGVDKTIVGITEDFHYESFYEKVMPCILIVTSEVNNIAIKISGTNITSTIKQVERVYKSFNPNLPFDFQFLDEQYNALYESERQVLVLGKYFAFQAILISTLGLFGLMAFSLRLKKKEIGIRKVIGASELNITTMMIKEFATLGTIAMMIALLISWAATNYWLDNFAYRIPTNIGLYFLLCLSVSTLVIGTTAVQAFISTRSKVMENLNE